MPLNKTIFPLVLTGGVDLKSDPKNTLPGKLALLENGLFVSRNRITKRPGRALAMSLPSGSGQMLAAYSPLLSQIDRGELLAGDGQSLYSRTQGGTADPRGPLASLAVARQPVQRSAASALAPDIAYDSGSQLRFHAWQEDASSGHVSYAAFDPAGLARVTPRRLMSAAGFAPKCLALSPYFLAFTHSGAALQHVAVPAASPDSPAVAIAFSSDLASPYAYDACVANGIAWVAYNSIAGGVRLFAVLPNLAVLGPYVVAGTQGRAVGCAPAADGLHVLVAWSDGTTVRRQAMTAAIPSVTSGGSANIETIAGVTSVAVDPSGRTYYSVSGSAANPTADPSNSYSRYVRTAASGGSPGDLARSVALAGKPLWDGARSYVPLAFQTPLQSTYFLARQDGYVCAKWLPGLGGGLASEPILPEFPNTSGTVYTTVALEQVEAQSGNANVTAVLGVDAISVDLFDPRSSYQHDILADGIHFGGGVLQEYDGVAVVEHGFNVFPENIVLTSAPLGGAIASGSHAYQATYEWLDGQGRLHRSAPSPVVQASNAIASNPVSEVAATGTTGSLSDYRLNASSRTTAATGTLFAAAASVEQVYPGCQVVGISGQTYPNTFVTAVASGVLSAQISTDIYSLLPATGTEYSVKYRLTGSASVSASSDVWSVGAMAQVPFFGVPQSGSAVLQVFSVSGLTAGMAVTNVNSRVSPGTTISSVDPAALTVTLSAPILTGSSAPVCFFAAGSPSLASVIKPGMGVVDIGSKSTGTITVLSPADGDTFNIGGIPFQGTSHGNAISFVDGAPAFSVNGGSDTITANIIATAINRPYYGGVIGFSTVPNVGDVITVVSTRFQAGNVSDGGTTFATGSSVIDAMSNLADAINSTLGPTVTASRGNNDGKELVLVVSDFPGALSYEPVSSTSSVSASVTPSDALHFYDTGLVATSNGSVVSVTSRQPGASANVSWSSTTSSITLSPGGALAGGADPVITGVARVRSADAAAGTVVLDQTSFSSASHNSLVFQDLFSVRADIPSLRITGKTGFQTKLWRSLADVAGVLYLVGTATGSSADFQSVGDALSDRDAAGQLQLYTAGGVLENDPAPPCGSVVVFKNRLVVLDSEFPFTLWFSKQVVPGLPAEFSAFQVINLDPRGGPATALGVLDDKLIVFKRTEVFYITGDGPDPTGANNDFSDPQLVSTDTGCNNPRSVALVRDGIMFQSDKGWYLLGRGLATEYIGMEVEPYNGQPATSARLDAAHNRTYFTLDGGPALVYDYQFGQWDVFTPLSAVDSAIYQGNFTYLDAAGNAWEETPGQFLDGVQPVKLRLATGWLALNQIQGFQRVYKVLILGEFNGAHILLVKIAYDYEPDFSQVVTIDNRSRFSAQAFGAQSQFGGSSLVPLAMGQLPMGSGLMGAAGPGGPVGTDDQLFGGPLQVYQFRVFPSRQKCQAIKVMVEDVQVVSGASEGFNISAITLELAGKGGAFKLGPGQSFG